MIYEISPAILSMMYRNLDKRYIINIENANLLFDKFMKIMPLYYRYCRNIEFSIYNSSIVVSIEDVKKQCTVIIILDFSQDVNNECIVKIISFGKLLYTNIGNTKQCLQGSLEYLITNKIFYFIDEDENDIEDGEED